MSVKNNRLLRAIALQSVDTTPVWLMRQAGRYLPEYRKLRKKAKSFMTLCQTPELACEVTLQPLRRFDLDAAIIFSDILTIPDALGLGLHFKENEGPYFEHPLKTKADITKLPIFEMEKLHYVTDAIRLVKKELNSRIPLIGFSGSPWTLAAYMLEGGSSKSFINVKKIMFDEPAAMHQLLEKLADAVTIYLQAQITAGVDVVMLFDTWGGILTTQNYQEFSLYYMKKIINSLNPQSPILNHTPVILFTKGGGQWLETIAASGCDAVGIDWTLNIGKAKQRIGNQVALQGNLDPAALYAKPERIRQEVNTILQDYGSKTGHIFNLGHGINPDTPFENVAVMVEAVHQFSKR